MIESIRTHPELHYFVKSTCEENGVSCLLPDSVSDDAVAIIHVDKYYAYLYRSAPESTPKSVDCLILLRCNNGRYRLYLVELKDIDASNGFSVNDVKEKFETTRVNFLIELFGEIFNNGTVEYQSIQNVFITPLDNTSYGSRTSRIDTLLGNSAVKILGKIVMMEHQTSPYKIRSC